MKNQFCFLLGISLLIACHTQSKAQTTGCQGTEFRQFDFWLGNWDVYNSAGKKVGENKVVLMQDSCVIQENWTSGNQTGTSYSYYNTSNKTWSQVYIDNTGNILELKGKYKNGKMILRSKPAINPKSKKSTQNVITWFQDDSGFVHQKWDIVNSKDSIIAVAFDGIYKKKKNNSESSAIATGIGGVFFKSKDPKTLKKWYQDNLGFKIDQYGVMFEWREGKDADRYGMTQWSLFNNKTNYFEPSAKDFMINYRVQQLDSLVEHLKQKGVQIIDTIETYDGIGKFIHIMDPEGNKIELWEPEKADFDKVMEEKKKK
ncbi:MAG TPA: VOC family protein [Chitinophagales bacterium]|nr:VOC family protein [Chitinophagales bacterium]